MSRVRMRATVKKSWEYWTVLLLGLFYVATKCDARAVNVSNSWTMPQEGLNVFYRFFRDRISWFEADAVCQFHHAYLVTVDNSFQFDATRDLLRELDVNDIVWIGLMRPQSSDRFMWSNSRALAANTGYWAESLPLMESPLCAVIDPIRDYRWHALRCGGPETASFLCEMPVPSWAESCILKDLPSLTMQYMADTASIELIRNCGEEGLIRQMCRGKQDRERIMRELLCPRERLESKKLSDITNSHFKSLQIIRGISTDNNENNDIDMVPMKQSDTTEPVQTEKNTVQKLIEQFNVDELMQADQPSRIPGEIPKPVKKSAKKIVVAIQQKKPAQAPKKSSTSSSSRGHHRDAELDDMMMGDQPIPDDASNEIMQPLPHIKKVLPQDLKPMPTAKSTTVMEPATTTASAVAASIDETSATNLIASSEPSALSDATTSEPQTTTGAATTSGPSLTTTVNGVVPVTQVATVGHPMHPQQQRGNTLIEEANHPHVKETNDNHFIPPMLLVKSHYVPPPKGHADHSPHSAPQDLTGIAAIKEDDKSDGTSIENTHQEQTTLASAQPDQLEPEVTQPAAVAEKSSRTEPAEKELPTNSSEIQLQATTTARNEITTQEATAGIHTSSGITMKYTASPESPATTTLTTERATESVVTTTGSEEIVTTTAPQSPPSSSPALPNTPTEATSSPALVHTVDAQQTDDQNKRNTEKTELQSTPSAAGSNSGDSPTNNHPSTEGNEVTSTTTAPAVTTAKAHEQPAAPHPTRNFLNEETYPPFKPNRRRSLTKPDTPSYFKKILG